MPEDLPKLPPYQKHLFICVGDKCAPAGQGEGLFQWLKERIRQLGLHEGKNRVHRSKSTCLGMCQDGPIGVVYPEGVWYCRLNQEKLEAILQQKSPLSDQQDPSVFHRINE